MKEDVKKLNNIQNSFKNNLSVLRDKKGDLLKLFTNKLEVEKIKEIKKSLLINED